MANDELKEKIAKLPSWAREHIASLSRQAEPNNDQLRRMRQDLERANKAASKAEDRTGAMIEFISYAAKAGHVDAQTFIDRVLKNWSMNPDGLSWED